MTEWQALKEELLSDPATRLEYDRLAPLYDLIEDLIQLRLAKGWSQAQLAEAVGKQQPAIARFEAARVAPTWAFLLAVADALDVRLSVHLEPRDQQQTKRAKKVKAVPALTS